MKLPDHMLLPNYAVIVHMLNNEFSSELKQEIELISNNFELDEFSDSRERNEYLWVFETWEDAVSSGKKLEHLISNPNLLLLKVTAYYDSSIDAVVHKDLVRPNTKKQCT